MRVSWTFIRRAVVENIEAKDLKETLNALSASAVTAAESGVVESRHCNMIRIMARTAASGSENPAARNRLTLAASCDEVRLSKVGSMNVGRERQD